MVDENSNNVIGSGTLILDYGDPWFESRDFKTHFGHGWKLVKLYVWKIYFIKMTLNFFFYGFIKSIMSHFVW